MTAPPTYCRSRFAGAPDEADPAPRAAPQGVLRSIPTWRPEACLHSRGDADLRVRVHEVREPLRGARVAGRAGSGLPRLRRGEGLEAVLGLRGSRHRRTAELRGRRRRLLRW